MKQKGFTLIELLAVIVILAIIALIATPLILNLIEDAKKGAFQTSVYNAIDASIFDYVVNREDGEKSYEFDGESPLKLKGDTQNWQGSIIVNDQQKIKATISNDGWCASKNFDEEVVLITKGKCSNEPLLKDKFSENNVGTGKYSTVFNENYFIGEDPNNWLIFENQLWRIIKTSDEGIKISFVKSCTGMTVDTCNGTENGTIGLVSWGKNNDNYRNKWNDSNNETKKALDSWYNTTIKKTTYLNEINWCVGATYNTVSLESIRNNECSSLSNVISGTGDYDAYTTNKTAIGLLRLSDMIIASDNYEKFDENQENLNTNYMELNHSYLNTIYKQNGNFHTMIASADQQDYYNISKFWVYGNDDHYVVTNTSKANISPVLNLKIDTPYKKGDGTSMNPYIVE